MAEQTTKYVWQSRKPLVLGTGGEVKQGETFTPTADMLASFRDLMIPVGESLRTAPPEADPEHAGSAARTPARARRDE